MKVGLRLRQLGTEALTWGDLYDFVRYGNKDSALGLERYGATVLWGVSDHLLAVIADGIHNGNWQRGGGKGTKPEPVERPGTEKSGTGFGSEPISVANFDTWWNEERE